MKVSLNWLKELVDINVSVKELADKFNIHSAEVEEFYSMAQATKLVVGHVVEKIVHPNADKLSVCQVDIGGELSQIVCGAPNVAVGQKVPVATIGTILHTNDGDSFAIKKGKIRGELSNGMICAEDELGLGNSHDGILVLDKDIEAGTTAVNVFDIQTDEVFEVSS